MSNIELSSRRMNIMYHHITKQHYNIIYRPCICLNPIQSNPIILYYSSFQPLQLRFESRHRDKRQHTCFVSFVAFPMCFVVDLWYLGNDICPIFCFPFKLKLLWNRTTLFDWCNHCPLALCAPISKFSLAKEKASTTAIIDHHLSAIPWASFLHIQWRKP